METKAHHVLIGAFTVVVLLLGLVFALWLGKTSLNRQYHHYDIVFSEAVTGLSKGSQVQYNGIQVGEVSRLKLDPDDPRKALVRIQVAADTPIRVDTRAKLGMLGLTGVAFVQLEGGAPASAPLLPTAAQPVPVIPSAPSAFGSLLASGNDVVTSLAGILERVNQIVSQQNIAHINASLANIDRTTRSLADEREQLAELIREGAASARQLNATLADAHQLLDGPGRQMLISAQRSMATVDRLLADNHEALNAGLHGLGQIDPALRELRVTLQQLHRIGERLDADPSGYLLGGQHPVEFRPRH